MAELTTKKYLDETGLETLVGLVKGDISTSLTTAEGYTDTAIAGLSTVYEAKGAAAAVQGSTTETVASVDAKVEGLGTAAKANVATAAIAEESTDANLVSAAQVAAFVKGEVAGVTGALHFRGIKTATSDITDPASGDVVIVGTTEYIYDGSAWKEIGDEGNYVPKARTIAGVDLVDNITAAELKTALDVDDLETKVGDKTVANRIKDEAKDATYKAADGSDPAVTIGGAIADLQDQIDNIDVSAQITTAIEGLDATKTQTAGADGLALSITETDGKITAISGSIAANTYDAYGAASAVQGSTTETVASVDAKFADYTKTADMDTYVAITNEEITALFSSEE